MDNAVCGGGDTNVGLTDKAVPINASAIAQIKAVILMGNPRYIPNLPYNVGTCRASGVSRSMGFELMSGHDVNPECSLPPVHPDLFALRVIRSKTIATQQIPTAAMETTNKLTRTTAMSTDKGRNNLFLASLPRGIWIVLTRAFGKIGYRPYVFVVSLTLATKCTAFVLISFQPHGAQSQPHTKKPSIPCICAQTP